jgi:5'-3' exonuclease
MIALIDGDLIAFRCAAACENESLLIAQVRANDMMYRILEACDTEDYTCFVSGGENFRKTIDPLYKANRKDKVEPKWRQALNKLLVMQWWAEVTDGIEADDALGIAQTKDTIICSIDKDMLQIPGKHYNFVKNEFIEVSELSGIQFFYKQMLIGDTADNITGVKGIGKVKAEKLISPIQKEEEMYSLVRQLYADDDRFLRNGKLLHIMQKENDIWEPAPTLSAYYDQQQLVRAARYATSAEATINCSENTGLAISG